MPDDPIWSRVRCTLCGHVITTKHSPTRYTNRANAMQRHRERKHADHPGPVTFEIANKELKFNGE